MHKLLTLQVCIRAINKMVLISHCTACMKCLCILLLMDDKDVCIFCLTFFRSTAMYTPITSSATKIITTQPIYWKSESKKNICYYPEFGKQTKQTLYDLQSWWCDLEMSNPAVGTFM